MTASPALTQTTQSQTGAIPKIAPNAVEFTLDNGLNVVVIPDRRAPVATHMIWYRVGSADEAPGQSGIAHFLEHLMFKGTPDNPDGAFSTRVAEIGGEENAFTTPDYTAYFQRVAKEHLPEMMAKEADRMVNLVLTDEVVAPERDVVREERRSRVENNPGSKLGEALMASLYRNHPYGRPVIGWMHEIEALNREAALAFYKRYYTPNNAVLVIAGDVSPEDVRALAETTYGKIPARLDGVRAKRPEEPPSVGPRTVTVRDDKVREPTVQRAYLAPSSTTASGPQSAALDLLADILGGGPTSRLYDTLVRGSARATHAGAYYQSGGVDDTRFIIYGLPASGVSLDDLESDIDGVIATIIDKGVDAAELERAKRSVLARAIFSQDSQQALARIVGSSLMTGRSLADVQSYPETIQAVSADDVKAVAAAYLDIDRSVTGYLEARSKRDGSPDDGPEAKTGGNG